MRVTHKNYTGVSGRIIQFAAKGDTMFAVLLLDYRKPNHHLGKDGEGRFCEYPIRDLIPDPPDYKMGF